MARALLNPAVTDVLKSRVFLFQTVRLISITEMAKNWRMSKSTMYRYTSDEYREKSRRYNPISTGKCDECGIAFRTHDRCPLCTILTHGELCCIGTSTRSKVIS